MRFAVLPAVEFQEFGAAVAERFGGGAVAAGDFGLARQEYERGLPDVVAVESLERPHHFGVKAYARNERVAGGRRLVQDLYGVQRMPEAKALDAENRFELVAVQRRSHAAVRLP